MYFILSAVLNTKASSITLTQAILLNFLYHEAETRNMNDIRLLQLDDLTKLIIFSVNALKRKKDLAKIDKCITQMWDDLTQQRIDFRSIDKIVLRVTLSILWDNKDFLK